MQLFKDLAYGPHGERNLLDIYLPDNPSAPLPVVVCIHGGGWFTGDKDAYAWAAELLVNHGFAVASITYRFWPEWICPAAIDDAQRAVRWLRRHADEYHFDPRRFGSIGSSAGAHLAAYLAVAETRDNSDAELAAFSSHVQCAVDCYGPVDLVRLMSSESAPIVEGFLGKPLAPETEAEYRQASPSNLIPSNPPPFLIVHGTLDDGSFWGSVPIDVAADFHQRLLQAGGDSTYLPLEGAPHGFSCNPNSEYARQAWAAAIPFFEKHLRK